MSPFLLLSMAAICGVGTGFISSSLIHQTLIFVSEAFLHLLKLISLPLIFFALVTTIINVTHAQEVKRLTRRTLTYTILTTLTAAFVALGLFILTQPCIKNNSLHAVATVSTPNQSPFTYFLQAIPQNIIQPFLDHNVLSVLILAILMSIAMRALPLTTQEPLKNLFNSLYALMMQLVRMVIKAMPLAVWAFIGLFVHDLQKGLSIEGLGVYLMIIIGANLIQACIVLPLFLRSRGINVIKIAKAMLPALTTAFFAKSSAAALPVAITQTENALLLPPRVTRFCFPLCTSINMNACAAFILITVLFVATSEGVAFQPIDWIMWAFIATLTAFGNAGVPMGCFFIATSLLTAMHVPLTLMAVILPFYSLLDMLESAINIWSDGCVTALVAKQEENSL